MVDQRPARGPAPRDVAARRRARPAATRRPAPVTAARPDTSRRTLLTTRAVVLGLAVCAVVVMLAYPLREYLAQRSEIGALRAEQAGHQQQVDGLERDVARWQDPAYVRAQARERLHFVLPGESTYVVLTPPQRPPVHLQRVGQRVVSVPDGTWYGRLWATTTAAGRAAVPATPVRR